MSCGDEVSLPAAKHPPTNFKYTELQGGQETERFAVVIVGRDLTTKYLTPPIRKYVAINLLNVDLQNGFNPTKLTVNNKRFIV